MPHFADSGRFSHFFPGVVAILLTACATSAPPKVAARAFVPPVPAATVRQIESIAEPEVQMFSTGAPTSSLVALQIGQPRIPLVKRPSESEFLLKAADDLYLEGKRAAQEGRREDARCHFDQAIEILLAAQANANAPVRISGGNPATITPSLVERRLDEMVDSIYHYDTDQLGAGLQDTENTVERPPLESILDMTFPAEPSLRNKVQEQIRMTTSKLPLEVADPVVGFINFFSSPQGHKIIAAGLHNSGRYKSMIEQILRSEGVPEELIFVAQAESGFQPRARSNMECVGIWQFASWRGNEYGLKQSPGIDDRMDPEKATRAAARHLRDLYQHFGDWYLAMAAYNCGPNCVDAAVARTGYADFWSLHRLNALPQETANYVPIILAMTIMSKNASAYGLSEVGFEEPVTYDTLEVKTATHLAMIADAVDRPLSELKQLNPSLMKLIAPAGFSIHIPRGSMPQLDAALALVPEDHRDSWRLQRATGQDTWETLGRRFGTTAGALSAVNRYQELAAGNWVAIPVAYPGDPLPVRPQRRVTVVAARRGPARISAASPNTPARTTTVARSNTARANTAKAASSR